MIKIRSNISLYESELRFKSIRSPGPGGQNVNKVATGVLLRFNAANSNSLPDIVKMRLAQIAGSKLTLDGEIIIKATRFRTKERNKQDAIDRLCHLLHRASTIPKKRRQTKPTKGSIEKRLTRKKVHAKRKTLRRKPTVD